MTLHLPCGEVVENIVCRTSGALRSHQKCCIIQSSTQAASGINLSSEVPQVYPWNPALKKAAWGSPWYTLQNRGINLVSLYYSECGSLTWDPGGIHTITEQLH